MEKKLIINKTKRESRIALLENERLSELFVERTQDKSHLGSIFKGTVSRVLPGMNAAFVNIGLDKAAFLFGGDVLAPLEKIDYKEGDDEFTRIASRHPIEKVLKEGQNIVVQVSKDPLGSKGPRVSMFLSIPGRYLVLMPYFSHVGISRRIEDEAERQRLSEIVTHLSPQNVGVILRTAAQNVDEVTLKSELAYLLKQWTKIEQATQLAKPPALLYKEPDMVRKITRDIYESDVDLILVDDEEAYQSLNEFLTETIPHAAPKLKQHTEKMPIFDLYGIEIDIGQALKKRVELPSGGYLIIEQTEALTSFDINTGRFVGKESARMTILKCNLEAVIKIVEQLRLRNIGGIIVVDFIDMENLVDQDLVYQKFLEELKKDRARTNVLSMSELGLIQMTRKRTSESLERKLLSLCPYCDGSGRVRSIDTEIADLHREITRYCLMPGHEKLTVKLRDDIKAIVSADPDFSDYFAEEFGAELRYVASELTLSLLREPPYEVL